MSFGGGKLESTHPSRTVVKCVEVEDIVGSDVPTVRGTSEYESQEVGQYSGS